MRETPGAKLHRCWRNSWNPWRNVRSSITKSVLEDFSILFFSSYSFRSRNIAAEFNTRESKAPTYWNSTIFLATLQLRAARRHDHDRQRLSLRFRTLRPCCGGNSLGRLLWFRFIFYETRPTRRGINENLRRIFAPWRSRFEADPRFSRICYLLSRRVRNWNTNIVYFEQLISADSFLRI